MRLAERPGPTGERAFWPALLVLALGTALFGVAMAARHVVDPWWSNAAVGALVVLACAPLLRGDLSALLAAPLRGVLVAVGVGALMVALTHLAYDAVMRPWPAFSERVARLYADIARNQLGAASKVALTLLVVVAEEALWRGVAVALCQRWLERPATLVLSVLLYALPQVIGASPILVLAAVGAGTVFTLQRLWTGRLSDPMLSHAIWSVGVFNLLPLQ